METHRRRVQPNPCGEFGRIDRFIMLAHQFKNSLALPALRRPVRPSGLVSVLLAHPSVLLSGCPSAILRILFINNSTALPRCLR